MKAHKVLYLCGASASLAICGAAYAQTAGPSADAGTQQGSDIGEIVVTAQKRTQNINEVGLAITAISGEQLKSRQISSLLDIANSVPGLTFANSATNTPIYTLRGVGFSESSLAAYPDVAVYIDEQPLPLPVQTTLGAFDLERIEVLKGPQGTLFGNNATGGAINYVAAKPTEDLKAGADFSFGRFNTATAEAFVSGPLSETLKARLSGRLTRGDDWQHGYTTNSETGKQRQYAGRLLLDWQASSRLKFALNLNAWQDRSDPVALQFQHYRSNVAGVDADPEIVSYPKAPDSPRAADASPGSFGNSRQFQAALRSSYELTDDITLTALTNYIDFKRHLAFDQDGVAAQDFDVFNQSGRIKTFSQEVRLDNGARERLRWIVGGNYEHDRVFDRQLLRYANSSAANALGVTAGGAKSLQIMKNYAGFANAEFDVTSKVTLKAGARYTQADRFYDGCTVDVDGGNNRHVFQAIASQVSGTAVAPVGPNECTTIRADFRSLGNFVDRLNENNVSYRVGIDFKPDSGSLLFLNVAKGYKAGSYPTAAASTTAQFLPVKQESVLDFEGGFKLTLADRRIQFNGTGFYYDYRNKQLRSKLIDPVFGLLDNLQNVPKSSVKGGEIELSVRPVTGAAISFAGTYLDATIKRFSGFNAGGVFSDFAGSRVPFTPKWQLSINPSYETAVSETLQAFIGVNVNYRSKTNAIVGGSPILVNGKDVYAIDAYTLVDGQLGIRTGDGRWEGQVWGKNIFNKYYWTNVLAAYDTISRYPGTPATYGVSLKMRY
ncbi:TonB-dependent receptor [Sphingomonas sp. ID0503]|uniref:TonB-dependent receptor n=1 Tax=Sphingomonas sp. ID0503 TaxID=3399691 RepID=UPI003AFA8167